jgi:hypothetical protein
MAYQFEKPVLVRIDGDVQSISSVAKSVECLDRWPNQDSRKRQNVLTICTLVTDGLMKAAAPRNALELAADEANILYRMTPDSGAARRHAETRWHRLRIRTAHLSVPGGGNAGLQGPQQPNRELFGFGGW